MRNTIEVNVKTHLLENEKVLWIGKPDDRKLFTKSDILLIPFSIIWGMFALIWELYAIMNMVGLIEQNGENTGLGVVFTIFGLPFIAVGLYLLFGRFIYKKRTKKETTYVVTDKRVVIIKGKIPENVSTQNINQITSINISAHKDGGGTIRFGETSMYNMFYENSGLPSVGIFWGNNILAFHDIFDAKKVYELVSELRRSNSSI